MLTKRCKLRSSENDLSVISDPILARILSYLIVFQLVDAVLVSKRFLKIIKEYLLIEKCGLVFAIGDNSFLRLSDKLPARGVSRFTFLPELSMVQNASLGDTHTGIVTKYGKLQMFGDSRSGKTGKNLDSLPAVNSVHCALAHTVVVAGEERCMYTAGMANGGRLGVELFGGQPSTSTFVQIPNIKHVKEVSTFATRTMFCTDNGSLYVFGVGKDGIFGDGILEIHHYSTPFRIDSLPPITSVTTTSDMSMAITQSGKLFVTGYISTFTPVACDFYIRKAFRIRHGIQFITFDNILLEGFFNLKETLYIENITPLHTEYSFDNMCKIYYDEAYVLYYLTTCGRIIQDVDTNRTFNFPNIITGIPRISKMITSPSSDAICLITGPPDEYPGLTMA